MSLDPDCVKVHDLFKLAKRPPIEALSPPEARDAMRRSRAFLTPDPPEMGEVRAIDAKGPSGPIPLRLYRPIGSAKGTVLPALVYYHGGGWVIGDLDSHDTLCRELCNASGAAVVAVDYRLAPEHRFPAAVDDAYAALLWIAANAKSLGIDARRLAVGGDSAGGNLAAVVAIMARDQKGPALALQLLIYPAVDFAMRHASHKTRGDVLPLTTAAVQWFRDHYFAGQDVAGDWRASPLTVRDLSRLPAAYVATAGYDVLCDEGRDYGERLAAAGVAVETRHYPGMIHGFITMGRIIKTANTATADAAAALKRGLA